MWRERFLHAHDCDSGVDDSELAVAGGQGLELVEVRLSAMFWS